MDKVARIRQEIERRMKIYKESNYGISLRYQELEELLSFLDTLSEESDKSLEEKAEEYSKRVSDGHNYRDLTCGFKAGFNNGVAEGRRLEREDMLKDAYVESQIVEDGRIDLEGDPLPCLNPIILLPYPQFKLGDKVKLIIVKEQ